MCKRILKSVLCFFTSAFLAVSPCISAYAAGEEVAGAVAEAMGAAGYVPWKSIFASIVSALGVSAEAQIGLLLQGASYSQEQAALHKTPEYKAAEKAANDALNAAIAAGFVKVKAGTNYAVTYVKDGVNYVSKELLDICVKAMDKADFFKNRIIGSDAMAAGSYILTEEAFYDPEAALNYLIVRDGISSQGADLVKMAYDKCMQKVTSEYVVTTLFVSANISAYKSTVKVQMSVLDKSLFPTFSVEFSNEWGLMRSKSYFRAQKIYVDLVYYASSGNLVMDYYKNVSTGHVYDGSTSDLEPIYSGKVSTSEKSGIGLFNFSAAAPLEWKVSNNIPSVTVQDGEEKVTLPSWQGALETIPAGQAAAGSAAYPLTIPELGVISGKVEDLAEAVKGLTQDRAQLGTIPAGLQDVITNLKDVTKAVEDANTKAINLDILNFLKEMLQKILDGILAIPAAVIALPKSIADALKVPLDAVSAKVTDVAEAVKAVPKAITDFFTIDSAAVGAASAALSAEFKLHFALLDQLNFFKQTRSFDTAVPVIKMQVPAFWDFAFPGQSEIIIMDLRPYADIFRFARGILSAALWIAVAKWLLDQLDVEFHVG